LNGIDREADRETFLRMMIQVADYSEIVYNVFRIIVRSVS